jgi:histidinol-phosphate/aromatic aminotransferase/cobyric acid decarboxylase-like protein
MADAITDRTRLIFVCNPNNPTGTVVRRAELERFLDRVPSDVLVVLDEAYKEFIRDVEVPDGIEIYRDRPNVAVLRTFSKAYGLAGLRIGWAVAAPEMIEELWRRHEYAVIAASGPSMKLAEIALQPAKRKTLLERQRRLSREGHAVLEQWVRDQDGRFFVNKAVATSIAFVGYTFDMPSAELADHIRTKASVLVAPGGYLGTENHLRITVGYEPKKVRTALERIGAVAEELARTNVAAARS